MTDLKHEEIFDQLKIEIEQLLEHQLTAHLNVNNWELTELHLTVADDLMKGMNLTDDDVYKVRYAILFLNTGFLKNYEHPFDESATLAEEKLLGTGLSSDYAVEVGQIIRVLNNPDSLSNELQSIVVDTYFSFLGRKKLKSFLKEWWLENNLNQKEQLGEYAWLKSKNKQFKNHPFSTKEAKRKYDTRKKKNLIKIRKQLVGLKDDSSLSNNKNAQNMIKTSLRNQVDLISIADKKAGIMISINSILITLLLPLMASYLIDLSRFMVPAVIMVVTCGFTIISATLATRPGKQRGKIDEKHIKQGDRSLFYFGNYYEMEREEYELAMRGTIARKNVLESSVINDLYDLGVTLGIKYKRLRICYLAFAIGIGLTLISTAFCMLVPMGF